MARKSKGPGEADNVAGENPKATELATDVLSGDEPIGPGHSDTALSPEKATKEKKPREVRYYLTGLDGMNIRQVIGEFGTIRQLHKYCDPLWGAITRGLRDVYVIKGKPVNEGP